MFRFLTVYGPNGHPDLALLKFVDAILDGRPIDIYNHGDMHRDFTYVTYMVRAIRLLIDTPSVNPYRIVNIRNSDKVRLLAFVDAIEEELGQKAVCIYMPMQNCCKP